MPMSSADRQDVPALPSMTRIKSVARYLPGTVILGGSAARGDTHPESDLDLFCITDYDERPRWTPKGMRDYRLEEMAQRRLGFAKVEVRRVTWAEWLSRTKVPATIESTFLREGVLVKWKPPGPWVPWGKTTLHTALRRLGKRHPVDVWRPQATVMTGEDVRIDATRTVLDKTKMALIRLIRNVIHFHREDETNGLRVGYPDKFWKEWNIRLSAVNEECHWLMGVAFEMLCLSAHVPFKSGWRLLENLDNYPPPARKALGLVDTVDAEWLRNWRKPSHWSPENLRESGELGDGGVIIRVDPRKYTRLAGVPFDEGVASYAPLAIGILKNALRWSSENDPTVYEQINNWNHNLYRAEELLGVMESDWVYACGRPPDHWARPWDVHPRREQPPHTRDVLSPQECSAA